MGKSKNKTKGEEPKFLYAVCDHNQFSVQRTQPSAARYDYYESFLPSKGDITKGFLVVYEYTMYDSFGSSDIPNYFVVDIYDTYEQGCIAGEALWHNVVPSYDKKIDMIVQDNTYEKVLYYPKGWGIAPTCVHIQYVEVDDGTIYRKIQ